MAYKYILGSGGRVLGRIHEDNGSSIRGKRDDVFGSSGQILGWVDDMGTFDNSGFSVSDIRMPGLLIGLNLKDEDE